MPPWRGVGVRRLGHPGRAEDLGIRQRRRDLLGQQHRIALGDRTDQHAVGSGLGHRGRERAVVGRARVERLAAGEVQPAPLGRDGEASWPCPVRRPRRRRARTCCDSPGAAGARPGRPPGRRRWGRSGRTCAPPSGSTCRAPRAMRRCRLTSVRRRCSSALIWAMSSRLSSGIETALAPELNSPR